MYGEVQLQGNWGLSLGMNSKYTLEWYHYVSDMMPLQKVDLLPSYVVGGRRSIWCGSKLKGGCTASFSPPMNSTVCPSSLFDPTEEYIYNYIHREIYMLLTSFVSDHLINILEMKKVLFYQRKKKKECSSYSLYGSIGVGE